MYIENALKSVSCALGRRSGGAAWRYRRIVPLALLLPMIALLLAAPEAQAGPLRTGEILVADIGLEEVEDGAIFRVDPVTGDRAIISGRGVGSGPELLDPVGIAYGPGGQIYVTDRVANGADGLTAIVYRIDAQSGHRVELSGPNVGGGDGFGSYALGVATYGTDHLLVNSIQPALAPPTEDGAVFLVNTITGDRSVISGPTIGGGPFLKGPGGIRVTEAGDIFVTDRGILRVDPSTGDRVDMTTTPELPSIDLVIRDEAEIFVADFVGGISRITIATGNTQLVSGFSIFGLIGSGPFVNPYSLAFDVESQLLSYGQSSEFEWVLFTVDIPTGDRAIVSGAGIGSGPEFIGLGYIAVVPVPEPTTMAGILAAVAVLALGHWLRRKR